MKEDGDNAPFRRRILALGGLVALGRVFPALAQVAVTGQVQYSMEALRNRKDFVVGGLLALTDTEAEAFWPIYRTYQEALEKVDRRLIELVHDYVSRYQNLDDALAIRIIEESLEIESAHVRLRRTYGSRLAKVLPARKVARYLQIESKLSAQVRFELAQTIPLAP
jgi:hypothetical protein